MKLLVFPLKTGLFVEQKIYAYIDAAFKFVIWKLQTWIFDMNFIYLDTFSRRRVLLAMKNDLEDLGLSLFFFRWSL